MQALPGVAPLNPNSKSGLNPTSSGLVPKAADAIPESVLAKPVIGEARRFDGPAAPAGWVFAKGQDVSIADNPRLFSVLGHRAGDRSTTTFTMPNPGFGFIVAVAGTIPTSPQMLASAARHLNSAQYSLGPNAVPAAPRALSPKQQARQEQRLAAAREAQEMLRSAPRAAPGRSSPMPPELQARIERAQANARSLALNALSAANRARAEALVASVLGGGTTVYRASIEMSRALSSGEASALLGVHDRTELALRPGWSGMDHPEAQTEAARYLMSVAFEPDQARRLATMS